MNEAEIQRAWQNVLGRKATPSEVKDVSRNQGFWGSDANSVATRLLDNPSFLNQKATDKNIERAFLTFLGYKPSAQDLQVVKKSWGSNMGQIAEKLKNSPAFVNNKSKLQLGFNEQNYQVGLNQKPITQEDLRMNAIKMGVDPELVGQMSEDEIKIVGGIGALAMENYKNTKKLPQAITAKELNNMWQTAMDDANSHPYFKQQFAEDIEDFSMKIAEMQDDRDYIEQNLDKKFEQDKMRLDQEIQNRGMLKGGIRDKANDMMAEEQSGVIESADRDFERGFNNSVSQFEQKYGTKMLKEAFPQINEILDPSKTNTGAFGLTSRLGGKNIVADTGGVERKGTMQEEQEKLALDTYNTLLNTRQSQMNK